MATHCWTAACCATSSTRRKPVTACSAAIGRRELRQYMRIRSRLSVMTAAGMLKPHTALAYRTLGRYMVTTTVRQCGMGRLMMPLMHRWLYRYREVRCTRSRCASCRWRTLAGVTGVCCSPRYRYPPAGRTKMRDSVVTATPLLSGAEDHVSIVTLAVSVSAGGTKTVVLVTLTLKRKRSA